MRMNKRTIAQVRATIRLHGTWTGVIAGNKTIVPNGWSAGYASVTVSSLGELEKLKDNFLNYLDPELGTRAVFYEGLFKKQAFCAAI